MVLARHLSEVITHDDTSSGGSAKRVTIDVQKVFVPMDKMMDVTGGRNAAADSGNDLPVGYRHLLPQHQATSRLPTVMHPSSYL